MKKIFISAIAILVLASCASSGIEPLKVAETNVAKNEKVENKTKEKKSARHCSRATTGSRLKRC